MDIILSIGLNVGDTEPSVQLAATLDTLRHEPMRGSAYPANLAIIEGEWQGVKERTLQVRMRMSMRNCEAFLRELPLLARDCGQTCVAWIYPDGRQWTLAFADGHSENGGAIAEFPIHV